MLAPRSAGRRRSRTPGLRRSRACRWGRCRRAGGFALSRLAAGSAVLRVTDPGLNTLPDLKLTSDIYAMEAFAVTAVREDNAAAIARQENALTITNSVSTDACGNVAKGDMGSFLQRLPGLVGEYGGAPVDAISVRGLSPEFTSVTMDGARLAAAIARTSRWITRMCSCSSVASSASH
jgi:outer membrane receptor protein involved in Fe transport